MDETSLKPHSVLTLALLTIGVFASRSRLSQKALRLYDALGLLEPVFTDPSSSYRYYSEGQLERARFIALLRQLEMPLSRIATVLELSRAEAALELRRYGQELKADLGEKLRLVQYLEGVLEVRETPMFTVETRTIPAQKVVSLERRVYISQLPALFEEAFKTLYAALAEAGVPPSGYPTVIYHGKVDQDSDGPVEVCLPVDAAFEPVGELRVRREPTFEVVVTRLTKRQIEFPEILAAYDALARWTHSVGMQYAASPREIYFADWASAQPEDPVCDVAWPVTRVAS